MEGQQARLIFDNSSKYEDTLSDMVFVLNRLECNSTTPSIEIIRNIERLSVFARSLDIISGKTKINKENFNDIHGKTLTKAMHELKTIADSRVSIMKKIAGGSGLESLVSALGGKDASDK